MNVFRQLKENFEKFRVTDTTQIFTNLVIVTIQYKGEQCTFEIKKTPTRFFVTMEQNNDNNLFVYDTIDGNNFYLQPTNLRKKIDMTKKQKEFFLGALKQMLQEILLTTSTSS